MPCQSQPKQTSVWMLRKLCKQEGLQSSGKKDELERRLIDNNHRDGIRTSSQGEANADDEDVSDDYTKDHTAKEYTAATAEHNLAGLDGWLAATLAAAPWHGSTQRWFDDKHREATE